MEWVSPERPDKASRIHAKGHGLITAAAVVNPTKPSAAAQRGASGR
jgi:hypothetical protein